MQSVSNTQAKAGVETRQRIVITIRLRMVVPLGTFQNHTTECPNLDRPRLVVIDGGPWLLPKLRAQTRH